MVEEGTLEIIKYAYYIFSYICRGLELSIVIFLITQYFIPKSNFKSAYFVILNIGYLEDLLFFVNTFLELDEYLLGIVLILHGWHNAYFLTIWNAVLCANRCTALAFSFKQNTIWTPFRMFFVIIFMILFPFIIDGYQFLGNFSCSLQDMSACLTFRHNYYYKATITNIAFNSALILLISFCMYQSRKGSAKTHSLHSKIERRLIYQAIFSSFFQLIYYILNYISSNQTEADEIYLFSYISQITYHLQHYAVMVTHFVFSPPFKFAFLNFYRLQWITRDQNRIVNIKAISSSKSPLTVTNKITATTTTLKPTF